MRPSSLKSAHTRARACTRTHTLHEGSAVLASTNTPIMSMHMSTRTSTHAYTHVYTHVCTHVCTQACTCSHTHTFTKEPRVYRPRRRRMMMTKKRRTTPKIHSSLWHRWHRTDVVALIPRLCKMKIKRPWSNEGMVFKLSLS